MSSPSASPSSSRRAKRGSRTVRLHQVELEPPKQHAGFLEKRGEKGLMKMWKSRWFLLKANKLKYSEKPTSPEPLGYIPLDDAVVTANPKGAKPLEFHVVVGPRTYELQAPTEEEKAQWISSIAYSKRYHAEHGTTARVLSGVLEERPQQPWEQDEVKESLSDAGLAPDSNEPSMTLSGKELNKLRRMLQGEGDEQHDARGDAATPPRSPMQQRRLSVSGSPGQKRSSTSLSLRDQELMVVKQLLHEVDQTETENTFLQDKLGQTVVTLQEREEALAKLDAQLTETREQVRTLQDTVQARDAALQQQKEAHEQQVSQLELERQQLEVAKASVEAAFAESQRKHNAAVKTITTKERVISQLEGSLQEEKASLAKVMAEKEEIEEKRAKELEEATARQEATDTQLQSATKQLESTSEKLKTISAQLQKTTVSQTQLKGSESALLVEKTRLEGEVAKLTSTVEERDTELAVKERNLQKANVALEAARESNSELTARVQETASKLQNLETAHLELQKTSIATVASLEKRLRETTDTLAHTVSEKETLKRTTDEAHEALEVELKTVRDSLAATKVLVEHQADEADELKKKLVGQSEAFEATKRELEAKLKETQEAHSTAVQELAANAAAAEEAHQREVESLKTEKDAAVTKLEHEMQEWRKAHEVEKGLLLQEKENELQKSRDILSASEGELQAALSAVREELASTKEERAKIQAADSEKAEKIAALEETLSTTQADAAQAKAAAAAEAKAMQTTQESLEGTVAELKESLAREQEVLKKTGMQLSETQGERDSLQTEVEEKTNEILLLKESHEQAHNALSAEHSATVSTLKESVQRLSDELEQERSAHVHTQGERDQRVSELEEELSKERGCRKQEAVVHKAEVEQLVAARQADVERLEALLATQKEDLEGSQRQLETSLTQQLQDVSLQLKEEQQQHGKTSAKLKETSTTLLAREETVETLKGELSSARDQQTKTEQQLREELNEKLRIEGLLTNTGAELQASQEKVKSLEQQLVSSQEDLLLTNATLTEETAAKKSLLERMEERQKQIQSVKEELSQQKAERESVEQELRTSIASLATASATVEQQRERISLLERELDAEIAEKSALQKSLAEEQERAAAREESARQLEEEHSTAAGDLQKRLATARSEVSKLEKTRAELETSLAAVQEERTKKEAEMTAERDLACAELLELKEKYASLEGESSGRTEALEAEVAALKRKAKAQRSAALKLDEEIQHQAKLLAAMQQEKAAYQQRVVEWRTLLIEKDAEICSLAEDLSGLRKAQEESLTAGARANLLLLEEEQLKCQRLAEELDSTAAVHKKRQTEAQERIGELESALEAANHELFLAKQGGPWFAWMEERLSEAEQFGEAAQDRAAQQAEELQLAKLRLEASGSGGVLASPVRQGAPLSPAQARAAAVLSAPSSPSMTWRGSSWLAEESRVLKAKNARIHELQEEVKRVRSQRGQTRVRACLEQGVAEEYLEELEEMKREYFFSKAMGMKLNQAQSGMAVTRDIGSLYEHAKNTDFRAWGQLLNKYEW